MKTSKKPKLIDEFKRNKPSRMRVPRRTQGGQVKKTNSVATWTKVVKTEGTSFEEETYDYIVITPV